MSSKKLLSELLYELDSVLKIDHEYYERLIEYGVSDNEAWIRAMAKFFLEIDDSFEAITILREIMRDEYWLKAHKEHSPYYETHGVYLLETVDKDKVQALNKLNIEYKIDPEMFNSFSDEDLKAELERREKAETKEPEPELDFDDGLDIEVEDLELELLGGHIDTDNE
ncbi:TPA: hypothetical protein N2854_001540 [Vibrio parahaemolyticus]|uniref:hypothetical protein n=1 Tax=Vibrio parahaemolyticus TaxID=670 RepID=UPI000760CE02|nr:hypothetical protein [Vibrio parahaemolyticus]KWU35314.1 hypothetical protein AVL51_00390 [Vibrio parahaemolyticus]HCG7222288.1 hypothetical protein [Vibrio parahaemolyticus]HCM1019924.1 hypothetical protein [Vibrio parahaemolyticus]HCM1046842.1 hypothetical protein [Vibrio parahaemolyticus]HCM1052261.1 hypothetical protein [Vibrio parahaemolyticus]